MSAPVLLRPICRIESPGRLHTGETFYIVCASEDFGHAAEIWCGTDAAEVVEIAEEMHRDGFVVLDVAEIRGSTSIMFRRPV